MSAGTARVPRLSNGPKGKRETWVRLKRVDYLRQAVELLVLVDGVEESRKVVHAADAGPISLAKAAEELEKMLEEPKS